MLVTSALAQVPSLPEPPPGKDPFPSEPRPTTQAIATAWPDRPVLAAGLPAGTEAEELIGREVRSSEDSELGTLRDLVLDLGTGQVTHIIVGSGGFFGLGEARRLVPTEALNRQVAADGGLQLSVPLQEEAWEDAPRFDEDELQTLADSGTREEIAAHFGVEASTAGGQTPTEPVGSRQTVLATDLRGLVVQNDQAQVGQVDAVLVYLHAMDAVVRLDPNPTAVGTNNQFLVLLSHLFPHEGEEEALRTDFALRDFQQALPDYAVEPVPTVGE